MITAISVAKTDKQPSVERNNMDADEKSVLRLLSNVKTSLSAESESGVKDRRDKSENTSGNTLTVLSKSRGQVVPLFSIPVMWAEQEEKLALAVKICCLLRSAHIHLTQGGQWPWREKQFHILRSLTWGELRGGEGWTEERTWKKLTEKSHAKAV